MSPEQLRAARQEAGAAYAAAAEAFVSAWTELHALDLAINANGAVLPQIAGHPEFLRDLPAVLRDPAERARQRLAEIKAEPVR